MNSDTFDFEQLTYLLIEAARKAFLAVKQQYHSESIYGFALYTHGDWSYATVSSSSEEGLTRVAKKYLSYSSYQKYSFLELQRILRWSPADSPLHEAGDEFFDDVNTALDNARDIMDALYDEENDAWDEVDAFAQRIEHCFLTALQTLDREETFGKDEQRKKITINLLMGDQSDDIRIEYAKQLNPTEVWQRYAHEVSERNQLWKP
jgi:hypothetical protein